VLLLSLLYLAFLPTRDDDDAIYESLQIHEVMDGHGHI